MGGWNKGLKQSEESNIKRSQTCKKYWSADRKKQQARKLRKYWRENEERLESLSAAMVANNPMHDPDIAKRHQTACAEKDYRHSKKTRRKMRAAWTTRRRKALSKSMRGGRAVSMSTKANANRKGVPNIYALDWWECASDEQKLQRAERISYKVSKYIAKHGASWQNKGFVKGLQGFVQTRFGKLRYDSSWEKGLLSYLETLAEVVTVSRDFIIPYYLDGKWHRFLLDFRVEFKTRKPLLIEVKCPLFLDTVVNKAKVRAVKRFARKNGYDFSLITSLDEVEGCCG